jgi:hypothetical protein
VFGFGEQLVASFQVQLFPDGFGKTMRPLLSMEILVAMNAILL